MGANDGFSCEGIIIGDINCKDLEEWESLLCPHLCNWGRWDIGGFSGGDGANGVGYERW